MHRSTKAIHSGTLESPVYGELSVPIFQTSTFAFPNAEEGAARFSGEKPGYIYTRMGNPTVKALEDNIADLEGGFAGLATASGMAAISTVFLSLLSQGDHLLASDCLYGPTHVMLESELPKFGIATTFVDSSEVHNLEPAVQPNTRMIYIETPTNPTLKITNIQKTTEVAHRHRALVVVDNTFASPYVQRPLELGADVVVQSLTKILNGHSDVIGGAIIVKNAECYKRMRQTLNLFGGTMDPHQAWLILRGIRTLPLRIERAQENAMKLAIFLSNHPKVLWTLYPGMPDHPQHDLAKQQMDGFGTILCFGVKNGLEGGRIFLNSLRLITLAVSLGGVESLIEHPASMTHASLLREEREKAGILDELVRFSVGCEDYDDLCADLDQALNKI